MLKEGEKNIGPIRIMSYELITFTWTAYLSHSQSISRANAIVESHVVDVL